MSPHPDPDPSIERSVTRALAVIAFGIAVALMGVFSNRIWGEHVFYVGVGTYGAGVATLWRACWRLRAVERSRKPVRGGKDRSALSP